MPRKHALDLINEKLMELTRAYGEWSAELGAATLSSDSLGAAEATVRKSTTLAELRWHRRERAENLLATAEDSYAKWAELSATANRSNDLRGVHNASTKMQGALDVVAECKAWLAKDRRL